MLTGTALKETVAAMQAEGKKPTDIAIACGYCTIEGNNTKVHYTDFYMALLEAKGPISDDIEEETIEAEDPDNQEAIDAALEHHSVEAVQAFIELYGEENVESFEDAYQGEYESGAHFVESLISDCYNIPGFVVVDWEATWDQLYYDYSIEDGHVFCDNF